MRQRRYGVLGLVMVLTALIPPVVLPLALVVLAHAAQRFRSRETDPFPTHKRLQVVGSYWIAAPPKVTKPVRLQPALAP